MNYHETRARGVEAMSSVESLAVAFFSRLAFGAETDCQ